MGKVARYLRFFLALMASGEMASGRLQRNVALFAGDASGDSDEPDEFEAKPLGSRLFGELQRSGRRIGKRLL